LEYRGQQIVINIFEAFDSDPTRFLKDSFKGLYEDSERKCSGSGKRVICDYIAGMTDEYATRMYERLFIPRMGRFSDNL
jgi:dGTPase